MQDNIVDGVPKSGSVFVGQINLLLKLAKIQGKFMFGEQYMSDIHHLSCVVPTFKSGRTSLMIWRGFGGDKKSELVFMLKDRCKAIDFVELVYDGHLLQFMGQVSRAILMEDGTPVHRSKAPGNASHLQRLGVIRG